MVSVSSQFGFSKATCLISLGNASQSCRKTSQSSSSLPLTWAVSSLIIDKIVLYSTLLLLLWSKRHKQRPINTVIYTPLEVSSSFKGCSTSSIKTKLCFVLGDIEHCFTATSTLSLRPASPCKAKLGIWTGELERKPPM